MMNTDFGELLVEHLRQRERSASWLAQRLQKHPSTISKWLSGESRPASPELVVRVADVLGVHERKGRGELLHSAGFGVLEVSAEVVDSIFPVGEEEAGEAPIAQDKTAGEDAIRIEAGRELQPLFRSHSRKWLGAGIGSVGIGMLISALYVGITALRIVLIALGIMLLIVALIAALASNLKVELNFSFNISGTFSTGLFLMALLLFEISGWPVSVEHSQVSPQEVFALHNKCHTRSRDLPVNWIEKECASNGGAHSFCLYAGIRSEQRGCVSHFLRVLCVVPLQTCADASQQLFVTAQYNVITPASFATD